jgi:hypothetical protein
VNLPIFKGSLIHLFWCQNGALLWREDPSFKNSVTGSGSIAKCSNGGGYAAWCAGAIQWKEGGIQVLAGLAPSSQTVGSNKRVIRTNSAFSATGVQNPLKMSQSIHTDVTFSYLFALIAPPIDDSH